MTTRRAAWRRSDEVQTDEQCTMTIRDAGVSLVGTVLGADHGVPVRIEYRLAADGPGLTTAANVRNVHGFVSGAMTLARDRRGNWTVDGVAAPRLKGCTDLDLGCSPSTNTLPIRRLRLGIGASSRIQAAWVRFPELTVEKTTQTYARLDEFTYRCASGTFEAELTVDDEGMVTACGPWQRTGYAVGHDDTEPLDTRR